MGVYIPNMEMPTSCGNCFFDTRCDNWRLRNWGAPPPDDCPLVEIPPHGRLIDADALHKKVGLPRFYEVNYVTESNIVDAPTIIPAEEGK